MKIYEQDSEMKGRIIVYSISGCPFCIRAKTKLGDLGLNYIDINLDQYPQRRGEVRERTGRRTVPQIFFNATHIGGFDDLDKLVSTTELQVQPGYFPNINGRIVTEIFLINNNNSHAKQV